MLARLLTSVFGPGQMLDRCGASFVAASSGWVVLLVVSRR